MHVVCPYYRKDNGHNRINCEGPTDTTQTHLFFLHKEEMSDWMKSKCNTEYWRCSICEMLDQKYEEE